MNKNTFVNNLQIKDTILDRRYKLTKYQIGEIFGKHEKGKTISQLAKEYKVSYSRVQSIVDPSYKAKQAASKRAWYYNLTPEERTEKGKQWNKSTKEYKARLYKAFIDSI